MTRRFGAFLLIGALAAAVNVGARLLFRRFTGYDLSIVAAFMVALTVAFALNRKYVFTAGGRLHAQYGRFLLVNLAALAQVWLVSILLDRSLLPSLGWHWQTETVAHAIGVLSPVATSFWLHKHFSFARGRSDG